METAGYVEAEDDAGHGDKPNGGPEAGRDDFFEHHEGDKRGGDDFKIIEQRGVGGGGAGDAEHEQNGGGDVQHDHGDGVGQVGAGETVGWVGGVGDAAAQGDEKHAAAGAKVEEACHHGGGGGGQDVFGGRCGERVERCRQDGEEDGGVFLGCWRHAVFLAG